MHVGPHGKRATKTATIIAHLCRIRTNSTFDEDALWSCVGKLLEFEAEGIAWKCGELRHCLEYKRDKSTDPFWRNLCVACSWLQR